MHFNSFASWCDILNSPTRNGIARNGPTRNGLTRWGACRNGLNYRDADRHAPNCYTLFYMQINGSKMRQHAALIDKIMYVYAFGSNTAFVFTLASDNFILVNPSWSSHRLSLSSKVYYPWLSHLQKDGQIFIKICNKLKTTISNRLATDIFMDWWTCSDCPPNSYPTWRTRNWGRVLVVLIASHVEAELCSRLVWLIIDKWCRNALEFLN